MGRQIVKMEKLEDLVFAQAAYISSTARSSDTEALNKRMEKLEGMLAAQAAEIKVAKGKNAGVEAIEKRVKDMENKFQSQNAQIMKGNNRVSDVESKINSVEQRHSSTISKLGNVEKTIPSLVTTKAADKYMSTTKQEIATLFNRIEALEAPGPTAWGGGGGVAGAGSPTILTPTAKSGKPSPLDIRLERLFMDLKLHPRRFVPPSPQSTPLTEFSFAPNSAPVPSQRLIRNGDPKQVLLFIDGSCIGSGSPDSRPGYGVYFRREDNVYGRLEEYDGDDNAPGVAELWAAVIALQLRPWREEGFDKVVLACDAEYVVMGVCELVEKWAAKGWKTGEKTIAGREAWEKLLFELAVQEARGVRVQFWLIPRKLNLADPVARKGAVSVFIFFLPPTRGICHVKNLIGVLGSRGLIWRRLDLAMSNYYGHRILHLRRNETKWCPILKRNKRLRQRNLSLKKPSWWTHHRGSLRGCSDPFLASSDVSR